jgi:hypothetical protein
VLFGYVDFDEDERSAFLLSIHDELPRILLAYDAGRGKFLTYLVSLVRMHAKGWRRKAAKKQAAEDSLAYCYQLEHDTRAFLSEQEPEYSVSPGSPDVKCDDLVLQQNSEETLLILALKSAHNITDEQIDMITVLTGYNRQKLMEHIDKTRINLSGKQKRWMQATECRNKAFFLKTKYRMELDRLTPDCSQYAIVEKQYEYQSRIVEIKNELLRKKFLLTPSNTYIAQLLDIPPRRVSRIIEQATRTFTDKYNGLNAQECV